MNDIFTAVIDSFYRNLIAGDAYLIVLKGLWVTILISGLGLLFGTIFGGFLCFFRMNETIPLASLYVINVYLVFATRGESRLSRGQPFSCTQNRPGRRPLAAGREPNPQSNGANSETPYE